MQLFDFSVIDDHQEVKALVKKIFDKSDLKSDDERSHTMHIVNFENHATDGSLDALKVSKSYEELVSLMCDSQLVVGIGQGD